MGMFDGPDSLGHSFMDERDPEFENIYGDNGNMYYYEWMRSKGYEPGSYGPGDGFEEWLASRTDKGKDRNYLGNKITGTRVENAEATNPSIESPKSTTLEAETGSAGENFSWVTENIEGEKTEAPIIPSEETIANSSDTSENNSKEYYDIAFGMSSEKPEKEENSKEENKKINNELRNDIKNIAKNLQDDSKNIALTNNSFEKINEDLSNTFENAAEEFAIGKKIGKKSTTDYEKDYTDAINKYGKDSKQALKAQSELSAYLSSLTAISEAAIPNAEDYLSMKSFKPGKRESKKIGNYTYTVENIGKNEEGDTEFAVVIDDNKTGTTFAFKAKGDETISKDSLAEARSEIANMVDKSMIATGLKEAPAPETAPVTEEPIPETAPVPATIAPVETTPETPETTPEEDTIVPETKEVTLNGIKEELGKVDISKVTNEEEAKAANEKITALTKITVEVANRDFATIYKELVESGIAAKDLASNPKVKQFSQEAYIIGQDIYEKASELEAKTNELGLTNLDKKYIKKHLDEVSVKVGNLDAENNKAVGTYYSPNSNMNGTNTSQPTGINLSKDEVKALADYADDIQSTKDAGLAIMKSAAFNGAENVEGGKYVEEWKNAKALETGNFKEGAQEFVKDKGKLTWKDYFAAGAKGTLGTAVAILGGAVTAVNPVLGIMLMTAGTASATKAGLQITTDVVRSKSTNKEMMFGSGEGGKDVFRDIYNRSLEPANIGDAKSVGTYTSVAGGAISIVAGIAELLEDPVLGVEAIRSGIEDINKAGKGGLSNNLDIAVRNIYELGIDISTFLNRNDLKPEVLGLTPTETEIINKSASTRDIEVETPTVADAKYGSASDLTGADVDNKYSGYTESAKNSNLATDYNAGMEKEINQVVSDKYTKIFKVMIDKEPDYIRKVLIAIPKNHCESIWE